jgi:hypothetical protein
MRKITAIVALVVLCVFATSCDAGLTSGLDREGFTKYRVGDYYNENGKEGIVFEVSTSRRNGKIISVDEIYTDWDSAVSWCDSYGGWDEDWYLPTKSELEKIFNNKYKINTTIEEEGFTQLGQEAYSVYYWSSDEVSEYHAWNFNMNSGYTNFVDKGSSYYVRAVCEF